MALPALVVTLTVDDLRSLVREAVETALAGRPSGVRREVVSKRTAATMLGVDRGRTLAALIADGQLRTVEIRGRVCIPREDVERVVAGGAPTPTPAGKRRPGSAGGAAALRALTLDDL